MTKKPKKKEAQAFEAPEAIEAIDWRTFAGLGVGPILLTSLAELGYEEPTPVQREAIPPLLAGRDLLAEAPTGTGKTAAFALPMLQSIANLAELAEGSKVRADGGPVGPIGNSSCVSRNDR